MYAEIARLDKERIGQMDWSNANIKDVERRVKELVGYRIERSPRTEFMLHLYGPGGGIVARQHREHDDDEAELIDRLYSQVNIIDWADISDIAAVMEWLPSDVRRIEMKRLTGGWAVAIHIGNTGYVGYDAEYGLAGSMLRALGDLLEARDKERIGQ